MDSGLPLVIDNGTGVRFWISDSYVAKYLLQFVKVGYAGSNFPEHGAHFGNSDACMTYISP